MKPVLVAVLALCTLLLAQCCCCTACGGSDWFNTTDWEAFLRELEGIVESVTPEPTPEIVQQPLPPSADETLAALEQTVVPVRDLHELAIRLRGLPPNTPRTVSGAPDEYEVGDRRLFHASNVDTDEQFDVWATLRYKTPHLYMWVEEGEAVDENALRRAADLFEAQTYPTNREFFGSEWTPGVDNDPHLSILHADGLGFSVAGYYSSADQFVSAVREDSNETEMFYIHLRNTTIGDAFYNGVLAHEFQHMIHWYNDRNEETWLNEGFSELAMYLNGYDVGGSDYAFASRPDTQLNSWPEGPGAASANYGAGYLFTSYFLDRFGDEATRALVSHQENGLSSTEDVLAELGVDLGYEDLFADWVIANLLDDPGIGEGEYGYENIDPPDFAIAFSYDGGSLPVTEETTVSQQGVDYIELRGSQPLQFEFTGSTQIGLVNTSAHSGDYMFWGNRGDDSNMRMTREFDLSGVSGATLTYWTWYHIEEDWDYAYVEVSTDGGQTWQILQTPSGTDSNPNHNSFGWGYTGTSGGSSPQWTQEEVSLNEFAGQTVHIRFEYITDDAVNQPGFVLDDVSIPEIGYSEDFEAGDGGWEAEGFIRHANVLPQRWLVQLVTFGAQKEVQQLALNEDQTGLWTIPLGGDVTRAVVAVSGLAPVTTEPASYRFTIRQ